MADDAPKVLDTPVTAEAAMAFLSEHHNLTTTRAKMYGLVMPTGFALKVFQAWLHADFFNHCRLATAFPEAGLIMGLWRAGGPDAMWKHWEKEHSWQT